LALVGLGGTAIWDAIYRVGPGENVVISRLGRPERIDSAPGLKVKIPLLEDTRLVSTKNARVLDFGVELTALRVETDSRPESE
jgi:regulator of protease activity HflC (stomatin/prohibitin superfamily)